jgi:hypothetical protein
MLSCRLILMIVETKRMLDRERLKVFLCSRRCLPFVSPYRISSLELYMLGPKRHQTSSGVCWGEGTRSSIGRKEGGGSVEDGGAG